MQRHTYTYCSWSLIHSNTENAKAASRAFKSTSLAADWVTVYFTHLRWEPKRKRERERMLSSRFRIESAYNSTPSCLSFLVSAPLLLLLQITQVTHRHTGTNHSLLFHHWSIDRTALWLVLHLICKFISMCTIDYGIFMFRSFPNQNGLPQFHLLYFAIRNKQHGQTCTQQYTHTPYFVLLFHFICHWCLHQWHWTPPIPFVEGGRQNAAECFLIRRSTSDRGRVEMVASFHCSPSACRA